MERAEYLVLTEIGDDYAGFRPSLRRLSRRANLRAFDADSAWLFLRRSVIQSLTVLVIPRSLFSGGFGSAGASGAAASRFTTFIFRLVMWLS